MEFRTKVAIDTPQFKIDPQEQMLFVGSCFADNIGSRFVAENFRAIVNPFGVMYNPASILHTVERSSESPTLAFFTLGTNHVYRLKETGEIVDNCQKRPQRLFSEEELSIEQCCGYLSEAVEILKSRNKDVRIVITVSPIRYAKYGYHGSQLSKATLLLAADRLVGKYDCCEYFPAYEIVNDELRDYRFYSEDMLHPSHQAVDYIWERFVEAYFSEQAKQFLLEWKPLKEALGHKPFNPDSDEHKAFVEKTNKKIEEFKKKWHIQ